MIDSTLAHSVEDHADALYEEDQQHRAYDDEHALLLEEQEFRDRHHPDYYTPADALPLRAAA